MGKLGLTPIIGLAVVVALALAAVFGAMSLTNPAFAQRKTGHPGPTGLDGGRGYGYDPSRSCGKRMDYDG